MAIQLATYRKSQSGTKGPYLGDELKRSKGTTGFPPWPPSRYQGTRGMKLCWLLNDRGEVVAWNWDTANVHDQTFLPLIEPWVGKTIVLADTGFADVAGMPPNLKLCVRGAWNERMLVETTLPLVTMVCGLKKVFHRMTR